MNDDTLTLYYYNDGLTDRERREIETVLREDRALAERYDALRGQLDRMADDETESAPPHLSARWHDSIDRAARAAEMGR